MESLSSIFDDFDKVIKGEIEVVCNKPTLVLAMTARTGSTQLCSILESIKAFGNPDEIFNPRGVVQNNMKKLSVNSFVDYIHKLTNTDAPFFSFKTSWNDFEPVSNVYQKIFPQAKFFFLDRFDIVAQAFSLYKAVETGLWHKKVGQLNDVPALSVEQVDVERVQNLMKKLLTEKFKWESFFFANRLVVLHFYYEIINKDWSAAVGIIAREFGLGSVETGKGQFTRLSGEDEEQLINQFKKTHGYLWVSV